MTRRRTALGLVASGAVAIVGALAPVAVSSAADAEPGSALGGYALSASAPAVQVRQEEPSYCYGTKAAQNGCELVLPEAVSTLRRGPLGKAVAAVVWPGALAADIGNLLITASDGQIPGEARMLNDPVRAEAQTGSGPDKVVYDMPPGTLMVATAKDSAVTASGTVESSQVTPVGSFGKVEGRSSTVLQGAGKAVATAHSSVQDVDLAGGVVHIGAVTSDAVAVTDGVKATVKGSTVATGVTIAGVPVTIDDRGITVQGQGLGTAAATEAVNTAVNQLGIIVALGAPTGEPRGGAVTYNAGSLVVLFEEMPGYTATVALGGANVSVDADPAQRFDVPPPPAQGGSTGGVVPPSTGGAVVPGTSGTPDLGTGTVDGPVLPSTSGGTPAGPVVSGGGAPVLAGRAVRLPEGLSPWLGAVGVLGAGLVMAGLRRLPDRVLVAQAPECLLEETA